MSFTTVRAGPFPTPIVLDARAAIALIASSDAIGTIQIPGQGVLQSITGGQTYTYSGYTTRATVILALQQGSVAVQISEAGSAGGGGGPAAFGTITGSPTDNTALAAALASAGGSTTKLPLSANYTLQASDDGRVYYTTTTIVLTIPAGLSPMPTVVFEPRTGGTIQLHPATSGVLIDGVSADQARSNVTDPSGFVLVAGSADAYTTTAAAPSWTSLGGVPTDNAAFNTALAAYRKAVPTPQKLGTNLTLDSTNAGPGMDTYQDLVLSVSGGTVDRTLTLGLGIRPDFRLVYRRGISTGNAILKIANNSVALRMRGNPSITTASVLTLATSMTEIKIEGTGTVNQFDVMFNGTDLTIA